MKPRLLNVAFALIVVAIVLIGYGFWYAAVATASAEVAGLQNQIAAKTETASRIASTRAAFAEIAGGEAVIQDYFVPETGIVAFINGLEAQGQAQGAAVSVLSVSKNSKSTQPALLLSLTIKGTFNAVMRTVGTIEYAPYDLSISEFSLMQDSKSNWQAGLTLLVGSMNTATSTP